MLYFLIQLFKTASEQCDKEEKRGMEMKEKKLWKKLVAAFMAVAMAGSVITVNPQPVAAAAIVDQTAAAGYQFAGKGNSSVTISDLECSGYTNDYQWISLKPSVTGSLTITAANASQIAGYTRGFLTLYDGNKNILDFTEDYYSTSSDDKRRSTVTYGVKKGSKYYIRVESGAGVTLKASVKAVKKAAGTSKGKAKTIKADKAVTGVILAGDKKPDWYKINLTKQKKVTLTYSVKTNGWTGNYTTDGIRFTFCNAKGKMFTYGAYDDLTREQYKGSVTYYLKSNYSSKKYGLKPGTYYVKVERVNKAASGAYTLKWKMS